MTTYCWWVCNNTFSCNSHVVNMTKVAKYNYHQLIGLSCLYHGRNNRLTNEMPSTFEPVITLSVHSDSVIPIDCELNKLLRNTGSPY